MTEHSVVDRDELSRSARDLLDKVESSAAVRGAIDPPDADRREQLWRRLVEVGWPGIDVPDDLGGAGAGFADLGVVLVELGAHLDPSAVFATTVLGSGALMLAGTEQQRAQWLPKLAAGLATATAVIATVKQVAPVTAVGTADGVRLDGAVPYVLDADRADAVVVHGRDADGADVLVLVPAGVEGLQIDPTPMHDRSRALATVSLTGVHLPAAAVMCRGEQATAAVQRLADRFALAVACDSVGVAARALELTNAYAKQRVQFNRPIGSFQSVKHSLTDMLIAVETSKVILSEALDAFDAARADSPTLVSMVKAYACDAAVKVASAGVTLHGGIGFTWEHDMHFLLKRAELNTALAGTSRVHRRRVADLTLPSAADAV